MRGSGVSRRMATSVHRINSRITIMLWGRRAYTVIMELCVPVAWWVPASRLERLELDAVG